MKKSELAQVMEKVFEECRGLREAGQKEYAHDDSNAFDNFDRLSRLLGIPREVVLLVYMQKHIDGIHAFAKGHKSQRESVTGRINDAIVYLIILRGMVEEVARRVSLQCSTCLKEFDLPSDLLAHYSQETHK